MVGRIHSIETMGLVDGPGIRFVVFFQGCNLRCIYCHNPDTWDINKGEEVRAEDLIKKALRFKSYFDKSGGGITCSGGEPLLQPEFLIHFLKLCKKNGIDTALDTAGCGKGLYEEILKYTDLVILDIKHIQAEKYQKMTGRAMDEVVLFEKAVKKSKSKLWLRHVIIPGFTDSKEHILALKKKIATFPNVEKVELIPYHVLGKGKYVKMKIPYPLEGLEPLAQEKIIELEKILNAPS